MLILANQPSSWGREGRSECWFWLGRGGVNSFNGVGHKVGSSGNGIIQNLCSKDQNQ